MRNTSELGESFFDEEAREALPHYYGVLRGSHLPRYRLACSFPVRFGPEEPLEALLEVHRATAPAFWSYVLESERKGGWPQPQRLDRSYLSLKAAIAWKILERCTLCEWRCGVDRRQKAGFCRLSGSFRVSSFFLHFGEEPPLVGSCGSGTVFFTGCNFRCVFCQNYDISQDPLNGVEVSPERLAGILKALSRERCLNFNFVGGEPTPSLPVILSSLLLLEEDVPFLWNSNMYMSEEGMELLRDIVDIWLPDFKYGNDACAQRLSSPRNYFSVVSRNHLVARSYGDMIVRVLLLPGHWACCGEPILEWIGANLPNVLVNIMGQYRPEYLVLRNERYLPLRRRISKAEMEEAFRRADELGLKYRCVL
jgi:putative pyruvate formate lyase activating enzyme